MTDVDDYAYEKPKRKRKRGQRSGLRMLLYLLGGVAVCGIVMGVVLH